MWPFTIEVWLSALYMWSSAIYKLLTGILGEKRKANNGDICWLSL